MSEVEKLLALIQKNLYEIALARQIERTKKVDTWDEFVKEIEAGNFVLAHWCGEKEVEQQIKEETKATIRCIPFDQAEESGVCIKTGKPSRGRVIFARAY